MDRFTDRLAGRLSGGMKQKLALACALVRSRECCCWMSRPPASIPFRAASSGIRWRILRPTGLTIMVATPYLDEAERCHRVALMHLGEIREIGTPAELRGSLDAKRLEVQHEQSWQSGRDSYDKADQSVRDH